MLRVIVIEIYPFSNIVKLKKDSDELYLKTTNG